MLKGTLLRITEQDYALREQRRVFARREFGRFADRQGSAALPEIDISSEAKTTISEFYKYPGPASCVKKRMNS